MDRSAFGSFSDNDDIGRTGLFMISDLSRHCEERSDEAIQSLSTEADWIASLRSQ